MTEDFQAYVTDQVERFGGSGSEEAFHNLIDLPRETIPLLQQAYRQQRNTEIRARIVEVIRQFRDPSTFPFLVEALDAEEEDVWQQTIDGIMSIGGDEVIPILREACKNCDSRRKQSYLEEAINLIDEGW